MTGDAPAATAIDRALRWLQPPIHVLLWLGLLAGALMMTHVTVDVAGRGLFNHPLTGTNEIVSGYYMVAVAYLPWAWIARHDNHITVELFTRKFPPGVMAWLEVATKILTIVYVCIFVWQTWIRALQQMAFGEALEVGGSYLAVWPSRYILPVAGAMMVLWLALSLVRDLGRALGRAPGRAPGGGSSETPG